MRFSDVLGDHRLGLATNLVLDLRNADYVLSYEYRPRRTDFALEGYHLARELPDAATGRSSATATTASSAGARYPLDKFRRVDAEVGLLGVSLGRPVGPRRSGRARAPSSSRA